MTPDTIDFLLRICKELGNKESLTSSLINQSLCLAASSRPQAGLQIAEEAVNIVNEYGYAELAEQIKEVIHDIQNEVK